MVKVIRRAIPAFEAAGIARVLMGFDSASDWARGHNYASEDPRARKLAPSTPPTTLREVLERAFLVYTLREAATPVPVHATRHRPAEGY
jgi:hypothetical protein